MHVEILTAGAKDLPTILALQKQAYASQAKLVGIPDIPPMRETVADLAAAMEKGPILKAVTVNGDSDIVGSVRFHREEDTVYVGKLMVAPAVQGRGLGRRLLRAVEREMPAPRYELFTSRQSARNIYLYESEGYREFRRQEVRPGLVYVYLEKLADGNGQA